MSGCEGREEGAAALVHLQMHAQQLQLGPVSTPSLGIPTPAPHPPSRSPALRSGWTEVFATNLEGSYNAAHACYPHMKAAGRGKVGAAGSLAVGPSWRSRGERAGDLEGGAVWGRSGAGQRQLACCCKARPFYLPARPPSALPGGFHRQHRRHSR